MGGLLCRNAEWKLAAIVALAALAGLVLPGTVVLAQNCPAGSYQLNDAEGLVAWPHPTLDLSYNNGVWTSKTSYDATVGTLAISLTPSDVTSVSAAVSDRFELVGLAAGAHATVNVILDVDGWIAVSGCDSQGCSAGLNGAEFDEFFIYSVGRQAPVSGGQTAFRDSVVVPQIFTGGQSMDWHYMLTLRRGSTSTTSPIEGAATAHLRFSGLPVGTHMTSCWGYGTAATPVHRGSWGTLKILYR